MAHSHEHGNIKLAFFLNFGFTILEFFGGLYVNSVAIISDALHDLGDSISLGLSWYLDHNQKKGLIHPLPLATQGFRYSER